jgi:hypothetical protein
MAPLKAAHLRTRSLGLGVLGVDPQVQQLPKDI